jgi:hypothetical protein
LPHFRVDRKVNGHREGIALNLCPAANYGSKMDYQIKLRVVCQGEEFTNVHGVNNVNAKDRVPLALIELLKVSANKPAMPGN